MNLKLIAGWLAQGAEGPTAVEQEKITTPEPADAVEIVTWETFFNYPDPDPKYAMTARYLYEHLFLAHIKFGTDTNEYYELLRSTTPPGTPIKLIDTVDPMMARKWRHSTIDCGKSIPPLFIKPTWFLALMI